MDGTPGHFAWLWAAWHSVYAPAGCLEPVGTKIPYTEKRHEDDFLEEEVEQNQTVFPMLGRGVNPSHDINHPIDHSLWFCVSSWTSSV